jgi:hypothetical protein
MLPWTNVNGDLRLPMASTLVFGLSLLLSFERAVGADCTVQRHTNGSDDSGFILQAFQDCMVDSVITFEKANYSAFTPISLTGLSE